MSLDLRVIIVDDEAPARQVVKDLLKLYPEFQLIGEAADGEHALQIIRSVKPDVVFIDIQMPGKSGFDVIEELGEGYIPEFVFITAYSIHAINAFEVNATDYLLKPVHPERFERAVKKLLNRTKPNPSLQSLTAFAKQKYPSQLVIRSTGRIEIVKTSHIQWIEAQGDYVMIHLPDEKHLMRETMNAMEKLLNPEEFVRIHRSSIVRITQIKSLKPASNGDYRVTLESGVSLSMSRTYQDSVLPKLNHKG